MGPTFRLGRRRSSAGSAESAGSADALTPSTSLTFRLGRRSGADRRSTTFGHGRRSAYDSFLVNYDDDGQLLPAGHDQVDRTASNQPGLPAGEVSSKTSDDSKYNDVDDDWWSASDNDMHIYKKDADDDLVTAAGHSFGTGKRGNSQHTFRLGKRSSTSPTFRLGKRDRLPLVERM